MHAIVFLNMLTQKYLVEIAISLKVIRLPCSSVTIFLTVLLLLLKEQINVCHEVPDFNNLIRFKY